MPSSTDTLRRAALVLLLAGSGLARADCVDTVGPSVAEKQFLERAQAALRPHLRPAPEGAAIRWKDNAGAAGLVTVCKGQSRNVGDFSPWVSRKYIWPDPRKMTGDATAELILTLNAISLPAADAGGSVGVASPQRSAGLGVHNITWVVKSGGWGARAQEEQLRAAVLASVDMRRLQALLGQPLPAGGSAQSSLPAFTLGGGAPGAEARTGAAAAAPATSATGQEAAQVSAQMGAQGAMPGASTPADRGAARPSATEVIDKASGTAQKLRGLLGR